MRRLLFVATCVSVLLTASSSFAQTMVPAGMLSGDTTWDVAGSPYVLEGSITIPDGASLRIEAGVDVQVPATRTLGVTGGRLTVAGTEASPVTLRSTAAGSRWQGVIATTGVIDLERAIFVDVVVAIDTQNGGSLRFVTIPAGAPVNVRGGNLSIRDSELASADFSGTGTTSTFRSIFRGTVFFRGTRAFVDHATFVGDLAGTAGADIADSIIVQPRSVVCGCTLDRVLVHPRSRSGTTVTVDAITHPLEMEDALLGAELRPTSRSPARFRDASGGDLGARTYAGEATPLLQGWLWDDVHMTRETAEDVAGDLTIPAGHALTIDAGVRVSFPFGADELGYELRVAGTLTVGDADGPTARIDGTPTRGGPWSVLVEGPSGVLTMRNVITGRTRIEAQAGASVDVEDVSLTAAEPGLVAQNGSRFALARVRAVGLALHGRGVAENVVLTPFGTGLDLSPFDGDAVTVRHASIRCATPAATTGLRAAATGTGTIALSASVVTGCGVGLAGSDGGMTMDTLVVGANTVDAMGVSTSAGVLLADPMLDASAWPMAGSPCVDAATGSTTSLDVDGVARPVDGDGDGSAIADVGAIELGRGACGDGTIDPGERCDDGVTSGYGWAACASDCRGHGPYCGDAVVTAPEECDGTADCTTACVFVPVDVDAGALLDAGLEEPDAAVLDAAVAMDDASVTTDAGTADAAGLDAEATDAPAAPPDARAADAGGANGGGGCSCRVSGPPRAGLAWLLAVGLALVRARRRRR